MIKLLTPIIFIAFVFGTQAQNMPDTGLQKKLYTYSVHHLQEKLFLNTDNFSTWPGNDLV